MANPEWDNHGGKPVVSEATESELEAALAKLRARKLADKRSDFAVGAAAYEDRLRAWIAANPPPDRSIGGVLLDGTLLPCCEPVEPGIADLVDAHLGEHAKVAMAIVDTWERTLTLGRVLMVGERRALIGIIAANMWSAKARANG